MIGRNGREERELAYDSITLGDHERDALLFGSTSIPYPCARLIEIAVDCELISGQAQAY